ncbi:MAG TPA: N-6 DNA methylase [Planctomycetota bacterium]|nr:N-6 DNA methylase [Planctomycetota bacterium]
MSITKTKRPAKRQLGQFLTPPEVAARLVAELPLKAKDTVLEPSLGDGSFVLPLIERFMELHRGSTKKRLERVLARNIAGIEIDRALHRRCLLRIEERWGFLPEAHSLRQGDFFREPETRAFDWIVGNPPFGGTIALDLQDELDRLYGFRNGEKIKKETYSFFIVKSLDLLAPRGRIRFICSDTFLTINTMRGLRALLMREGRVSIRALEDFSEETAYPMVVLDFERASPAPFVSVEGKRLPREAIEKTENLSWRITPELQRYFGGPTLGDFVIATSGMTIGKNELFLKEIEDGAIEERYRYEFFEDPIRLERERERARLGYLSPRKEAEIRELEARGATRRNVRVVPLERPHRVELPHPDYRPYNKAIPGAVVYATPKTAIFWKDEGDAVLTFKKNGNWYLHGVGGKPFFGREGITWPLVASRLHARYLPAGSILDSGAPCAFLRERVPEDELYLILAFALSPLCERLLKQVINHTKNIQGKDFERLPYPSWVPEKERRSISREMRALVARTISGGEMTRSDPRLDSIVRRFCRDALYLA